jgi:hypothetical protein
MNIAWKLSWVALPMLAAAICPSLIGAQQGPWNPSGDNGPCTGAGTQCVPDGQTCTLGSIGQCCNSEMCYQPGLLTSPYCTGPLKNGMSCSDPSQCASGNCWVECQPSPCDNSANQCTQGLVCCPNGQCTLNLEGDPSAACDDPPSCAADGSTCVQDSDCCDGNCAFGSCTTLSSMGGPCSDDGGCEGGLVCQSGACGCSDICDDPSCDSNYNCDCLGECDPNDPGDPGNGGGGGGGGGGNCYCSWWWQDCWWDCIQWTCE